MILTSRVRQTFAAALAATLIVAAAPVLAQDSGTPTESHLKAARDTINAINATEDFDVILPQAANALKQELIQKNPDLQEVIIQTVDEASLALAARRADLEKEAALAYAKRIPEEDLKAVAAFYNTPSGKRFLLDGPTATRDLFQAAEIWQRGIARDLATNVGAKIQEIMKSQAPDPAAPQPGTDPNAPAPEPAPAQ